MWIYYLYYYVPVSVNKQTHLKGGEETFKKIVDTIHIVLWKQELVIGKTEEILWVNVDVVKNDDYLDWKRNHCIFVGGGVTE